MASPAGPLQPSDLDAELGTRLRRIRYVAAGLAMAWILATAAATVWLSERNLTAYLNATAESAAGDAKAIGGVFDRALQELVAMPRVLANSAELRAVAARYTAMGEAFVRLPRDERERILRKDANVASLNARMTAVRKELSLDLLSVLNANGIRIVSSDWDQPLSLLGEHLEDREYFQEAILQREGHLFAVARTTGNPVMFFSAPMEDESGTVGVVVVRQDSDHLGQMLAGARSLAMIIDKAGMVVAASRPGLTLSHAGALASAQPDARTLRDVYAQDTLRAIDVARPARPLHAAEWRLDGRPYLGSTVPLMNGTYRLLAFSPLERLAFEQRLHYAIGVLVAVFGVLVVLLGNRRAEANERQRHNERITAALNEKLVVLNRDKDRYLGIAAHDLRNPLSSMRGLADLMIETPLEPEQRREFLETIRGTSDEMLGLVNDLLDTAVIESGRLDLRRKGQDVAALVRRRIRTLEPQARRKAIAIEVDAGQAPAAIDAARFGQVIDNLISNAIKFSPAGTTVRVAVHVNGDHCTFTVQDQGPGIPAADRALMFRSFQKLSAQPTGGEKSTGLGLAIVKKIVDAHGGTISVDDAPGGGTRFTVTTPVADPGA